MSETCPRCGRPRGATYERGTCADAPGIGDEMDAMLCEIAADAYRRGLLAGVEVAKREARAEVYTAPGDDGCRSAFVDWTDVDVEIARLTGGDR